ncbi:MAG: glycosyltransferase family 25 protein, partial [Chloroflexota bacterium]
MTAAGGDGVAGGSAMGERETWHDLFARTISAWQEGRTDEGRLACERALSDPDLPPDVAVNVRRNSVHYARSLAELAPSFAERRFDLGGIVPAGWFATNPSLTPLGDGFLGCARVLNYAMPGYVRAEGEQAYRSRVGMAYMDGEGRQAGPAWMLDADVVRPGEKDDYYQGPEDLRLFQVGGRLMASGSAARRLGPGRERTICYGLFDVDLAAGRLTNPRWLSDMPGSVEKNWMPAVSGDDLWFVYSCGPTVVLRCDPETGQLSEAAHRPSLPLAAGLRGGTQLLPLGDGWIGLVHESAEWEVRHRTYLHRVIRFGSDWRITHLSHPFRFHRTDIEFAGGLARRGDRLLIGFGADDQSAWIADVAVTEVLSTLRPISDFGDAGAVSTRSSSAAALRLARSRPLPAGWPEFLGLPVLLLAQDEQPDRLRAARRRIAAAGFADIRRVQALEGGYAARMRIGWGRIGKPKHHPGDADFGAQPSMQARLLTHLLTWAWMIEQELPAAVVLEDDARFHEQWADLAPVWYEQTPKDLDLLHLGGVIQAYVPGEFSAETPTETTLPAPSPAAELAGSLPALRLPTYGMTAYAITLDGARRLFHWVMNMPGGVYSVDSMVNHVERRALAAGPLSVVNWRAWNAPAGPASWEAAPGYHGLVTRLPDPDAAGSPDRPGPAAASPDDPRGDGGIGGAHAPAPGTESGEDAGGDLPVIHLVPDLFTGMEVPAGPTTDDLTLVSMLVHLPASSLNAAGRMAMLAPLFASGIPLVLYADAFYRRHLASMELPPWVTVRPIELPELAAAARVAALSEPPRLPSGRNPHKDHADFLVLINGKTEVVARAVAEGLVQTPYTGFIDSGIAKVLRHPAQSFERLAGADLSGLDRVLIPGFDRNAPCSIEDLTSRATWMFCGGLFIVPSMLAEAFNRRCLAAFEEFLARGSLVWEVNVWARVAGLQPELFEWYWADHDDGMLLVPARERSSVGVTDDLPRNGELAPEPASAMGEADMAGLSSWAVEPPALPPGHPWPRAWEDAALVPAFIVNLDRRPDRLGWAASRVREAGFRIVRRVRAIDGENPGMLARAWERAGNPPFDPADPRFAVAPARQGCYLSMRLLLQWIVEREEPLTAIFHDDVLFHARWHEFATVFYAETPRDIDLLVIGGTIGQDSGGGPADLRQSTRLRQGPVSDACAFMVTRRGAQLLLDALAGGGAGVGSFPEMVNRAQRAWLAEHPEERPWWAAWNATAIADPALAWLPEQREADHGLAYQDLGLGSDVDAERAAARLGMVARARERAGAPPADDAPLIQPRLPGFDLLDHAKSRTVMPATAPWRGDLTLVTTLMLIPNSRMDPRHRAALLRPLMDAGIPLVVYVDRHYKALLSGVEVPGWVTIREVQFEDLETVKAVRGRPAPKIPLFGTGPGSFESLCLIYAKPEFVALAVDDGLVETPITGFIDAGIAKLMDDWQAAFARLRCAELSSLDRILIPGPWAPAPVAMGALLDHTNWTFAGSLYVTPASLVDQFAALCRDALEEFLDLGLLPWEVNVWALLRQRNPEMISWYFGNHDDTITNLPDAEGGWASVTAGMAMSRPRAWYFVGRARSAYYEGRHDEGRLACELALNDPETPEPERSILRQNVVHYSRMLLDVAPGYGEWRLPLAAPGERWPVVRLAGNDGAVVLAGLRFDAPDGAQGNGPGGDRPRLVIAPLGADGQPMPAGDAGEAGSAAAAVSDDGAGRLEDVHLVRIGAGLACVEVQSGPGFAGGKPVSLRLSAIEQRGGRLALAARETGRELLLEGRPAAAIDGGDHLRLITGFSPIAVAEFDPDRGEERRLAAREAPAQWRDADGLTTLAAHDGGWIGLLHDQAQWEPGTPAALHRVVRFDERLRLTHVSFPVRLHGAAREAATGFAIVPGPGEDRPEAGTTALIAFTVDGHEPWLASLPLAELTGLLEPVERLGWMPPPEPDLEPEREPDPAAPAVENPGAVEARGEVVAGWPGSWEEVLRAPAFVINLDRSPERLDGVMERIREAGFTDVRRISAVDGIDERALKRRWAEVGNPVIREHADNAMGHWPGYQGNFLSHVLLWRKIIEENIPYAVIFEDDVFFHVQWRELAPAIFAETPPGTAVTWMGASADIHRRAERVIRIPVTGLHAMLVTRRGAEQLLDITVNHPDGVVILDRMVEARQRAILAGEPGRPLDWAVWHAVGAPDRRHQPEDSELTGWGTGLAFQDINEGSMSNPKWTDSFYWRHTMEAYAAGDFAQGRLACDRFRSLHHAEESWLVDTRRNQLFYAQRLSEAAADVGM